MLEFGRLLTAIVTPFRADGSVDYGTFGRLAEGLVDAGNDALVVTGTTGESPVLTEEERAGLYREAKRAVGARGKIIAGTGGYNTSESIHLSRLAAECGADGLLQVAPYYNRPPQEGLYRHFKAIAEATSLPNILYNVPSRTVTNIDARTVARLSQVNNIIGIKEASGNFDQIAEIMRTSESGFAVYSGNDSDTFPMMALGGVGVISVASHVVSGEIRQMIDSFVEGDLEEPHGPPCAVGDGVPAAACDRLGQAAFDVQRHHRNPVQAREVKERQVKLGREPPDLGPFTLLEKLLHGEFTGNPSIEHRLGAPRERFEADDHARAQLE